VLIYRIYDTHEETYIKGIWNDRKLAKRRADKLDNEYGAYRFVVFSEEIEPEELEISSQKNLTLAKR